MENIPNIPDIDKFFENIRKIKKITGFYIIANDGELSETNTVIWEIKNDFYFENEKEVLEFKSEMKTFFEFYFGDDLEILTYEEYDMKYDFETIEFYKKHPVRYLIRDTDSGIDLYKVANGTGSYSTDIGDGIHSEIPNWISKVDNDIIDSKNPRFKEILIREAGRLEDEIHLMTDNLKNAKRNLDKIQKELKYGI